jgi:beta-glucanase (GH16 family)
MKQANNGIGRYLIILLVLISANVQSQTFKKLVWSDEFKGKGLPDSTKWGYDVGTGCPQICGWGNNELQYYTANNTNNARVENGMLVVEARKENIADAKYSSARLVTKNKGDWKYGRVDVKAKLPAGRGMWPAIWMLPTDWKYGGWPHSGEIRYYGKRRILARLGFRNRAYQCIQWHEGNTKNQGNEFQGFVNRIS